MEHRNGDRAGLHERAAGRGEIGSPAARRTRPTLGGSVGKGVAAAALERYLACDWSSAGQEERDSAADIAKRKFRLRFENVKGGIRARARTIHVPDWLMHAIEATCPLEDRVAERRLFQGLKPDTGRKVMARACRNAGIPHFTPKNLREHRASIWHHGGGVAKTLAERLGHSKASMSLDVYSHTLDPGEVPLKELQARLGALA